MISSVKNASVLCVTWWVVPGFCFISPGATSHTPLISDERHYRCSEVPSVDAESGQQKAAAGRS